MLSGLDLEGPDSLDDIGGLDDDGFDVPEALLSGLGIWLKMPEVKMP